MGTHIETSAPSDDREVCTRKTEEAAPTMWLALAISLLFFAEAAWRFAIEGTSAPDRATAIFNGVNLVLFGLLGLGCLFWPTISSWFRPKEENEDVSVVVDSGAPAAATPAPAAPPKKSIKSLDVESGNVVAPAPATPKRKVTYLTNVKTFLTFVVVTHHTVNIFAIAGGDGIQTTLVDMQNFNSDSLENASSFLTGGIWFMNLNQAYFMAAFYLISAYFCPKSLDRKGFRSYCIDKIVRLGGPYILYSTLLGPMMYLWCQAYIGTDKLYYNYTAGPAWFILWLLNFSIIYAVGAQFLPKVQFSMPHPLLLTAGVGPVLCGIFYGISAAVGSLQPNGGPWNGFGGMNQWNFGLGIYIPFFLAGIVGGRNYWLKNIEEMKTWVVWTLRVIVVGFWVTEFLSIAQYTIHIPGIHNFDGFTFGDLFPPLYVIPMTLALMQFFYQYFNGTPQGWLMRNAGIAAYTVYVIHAPVYSVFMIAFVQILKTAGVPIVFYGLIYLTVGADGQPNFSPPEAYVWGGWAFVLVLTQCVVWPLAHFMRKLPVLNKMF